MESMIAYGIVFLVCFFASVIWTLKHDKTIGARDNTDFVLMGLIAACLSAIWPFTVFGFIALFIGNYYRAKERRERELTEELSRG